MSLELIEIAEKLTPQERKDLNTLREIIENKKLADEYESVWLKLKTNQCLNTNDINEIAKRFDVSFSMAQFIVKIKQYFKEND